MKGSCGQCVVHADLLKPTPVDRVGKFWLKREDNFTVCGVNGGKARACFALASRANRGLITAAARQSPQSVIVAAIARGTGLPCRIHTAAGAMTQELARAGKLGAEIIFHQAGYNTVINRRALDDGAATGWTVIPFGMACSEAVQLTARQVINIPDSAKRLVVPVGSGVTLAGVLAGLSEIERCLPVIGVVVGADPMRRLDQLAPPGWRSLVQLRQSRSPYRRSPKRTHLGDVALDPIYEAKCLSFLKPEDCLWVVGHRDSEL
ncbi:pyridoxal-phosphate dependent enzyme [Bradyrhizobium sp. SRS-191]|uniref:pyridoxal-phosphate dependent enzyme n=1 Tax=Bradyrhizobium sp. SRS-191 TaxID=2962606 RepID=UPI0035BC16EE